VDSHNQKINNPRQEENERKCNCRRTTQCPLNGECLTKSVVYQADVHSQNSKVMTYYGLTERPFKSRYNEHMCSIRNKKAAQMTELSKYVWQLKDQNKDYEIKWSIKSRAYAFKSGMKRCDLCLQEKTVIALADPRSTLNSRSEIVSKCRHRRKFTLRCCK